MGAYLVASVGFTRLLNPQVCTLLLRIYVRLTAYSDASLTKSQGYSSWPVLNAQRLESTLREKSTTLTLNPAAPIFAGAIRSNYP